MRIKILALVLAAATVASGRAYAQTAIEPLSALRTPASPAFTLLGIEPSAVERPSTPADFATTLLTATKDLSTLPKNFAVESSPYWLKSRPDVTWQNDATRTVAESILRTTSVSFATAQVPKTTDTTALGFGIRSSIVSGTLSQKTRDALQRLADAYGASGSVVLRLADPKLRVLDQQLSACAFRPPDQVQRCIADLDYDNKKLAILNEVVKSDAYKNSPEYKQASKLATALAVSREGFSLDVAAAWSWRFAGQTWEDSQFSKGGFWVTPAYQSGHWVGLGVVRYVRDSLNATETDAVEAGGRGIFSTDSATLSLEYVKRTFRNSAVDGSHRLVVIAEHKLGDIAWITASFGKDRERADSPGTLLAQLGVSFNFSRDRYKFD